MLDYQIPCMTIRAKNKLLNVIYENFIFPTVVLIQNGISALEGPDWP